MKREKIENAIKCYLQTNIALWEVHKTLTNDKTAKAIIDKAIRQSRKALKILPTIKHDEIVKSLFNTLFSGKESMFVLSGALLCSKQVAKWDNSEDGFKEFMELEELGKKQAQEERENAKKQREAIEKAKAEGRKIEYLYDPKTKSMKPIIQEKVDA